MNTCSTCKHFALAPNDVQPCKNGGWGACDLAAENSVSFLAHYPTTEADDLPIKFFCAAHEPTGLAVHKDFGCNQHEWRFTPEEAAA